MKKKSKFAAIALSLILVFLESEPIMVMAEVNDTANTQKCITEVNLKSGNQYIIIEKASTYNEAKAACEKLGGHLATITSSDEQKFIADLIKRGTSKTYWLGASDEAKEGSWKWITGEISGYTNYGFMEPNNYYGPHSENFLAIDKKNGKWKDVDVSKKLSYICEFESKDSIKQAHNVANGHYYSLIDKQLDWDSAERFCNSLGGHLVTISDEKEQKFVDNLINSGAYRYYWLGLYIDKNKKIKYITGEKVNYTNWAVGEPNNTERDTKGQIRKLSGKWINAKASMENTGMICEWDEAQAGNSISNFSNFGYAAEANGYIYYQNKSDGNKLYRSNINGSSKIKICDDNVYGINVVGNWIYYRNNSDRGKFYKIKIDGTERKKISDFLGVYGYVYGNYIYYTDPAKKDFLYKISTSGTNKTLLIKEPIYTFGINGDNIYYISKAHSRKLYKTDISGNKNVLLTKNAIGMIDICGNWLYYNNLSDGGKLYKINFDGTINQKVANVLISTFSVKNGWIYYANKNDKKLWKIKYDGTDNKVIGDAKVGGNKINAVSQWIFYGNAADGDSLYRIKNDGSGKEKVDSYEVYQNNKLLKSFNSQKDALTYAKKYSHCSITSPNGDIAWDNYPQFSAYKGTKLLKECTSLMDAVNAAKGSKYGRVYMKDGNFKQQDLVWQNDYQNYRLYQNDKYIGGPVSSAEFTDLYKAIQAAVKYKLVRVIDNTGSVVWDNYTSHYSIYRNSKLIKACSSSSDAFNYARGQDGVDVVNCEGNIQWSFNCTKYDYKLSRLLDIQMRCSPMIQTRRGWEYASRDTVRYYASEKNFTSSYDSFQFLILSGSSGASIDNLNRTLSGKGILSGKGASFAKGGSKYNINELYLIAHALLETGNGTSSLARGIKYNGRKVYNMYGIGAVDSDPIGQGAKFAYKHGWFTPEEAIEGGAKFIAEMYINNSNYKQNTLYKMRWNPAHTGTHQYATDVAWAEKQVYEINELYGKCPSARLRFDIPKYN